MADKRTPITHELIINRYKEFHFHRDSLMGIPLLLILVLLSYFSYHNQTSNNEKVLIPFWVYLLIMGIIIIIFGVFEYLKYTKIKAQDYEIVTDHLQKITYPFFKPMKYRYVNDYTRFYQFRKYGKCPAYNYAVNKNRSKMEEEMHYNYHNAKVGDQFYLIMLNKRVIQIYNAQHYCLPKDQ